MTFPAINIHLGRVSPTSACFNPNLRPAPRSSSGPTSAWWSRFFAPAPRPHNLPWHGQHSSQPLDALGALDDPFASSLLREKPQTRIASRFPVLAGFNAESNVFCGINSSGFSQAAEILIFSNHFLDKSDKLPKKTFTNFKSLKNFRKKKHRFAGGPNMSSFRPSFSASSGMCSFKCKPALTEATLASAALVTGWFLYIGR